MAGREEDTGERVLARYGRVSAVFVGLLCFSVGFFSLAIGSQVPIGGLLSVAAMSALLFAFTAATLSCGVIGSASGLLIVRNIFTDIRVPASEINHVEAGRALLVIHLLDGKAPVPGIFDMRSDLMAGTARFVRAKQAIDEWCQETAEIRPRPDEGDPRVKRRLRRFWTTWCFVIVGATAVRCVLRRPVP